MDPDPVMEAVRAGRFVEAIVTPSGHSDGWVLLLLASGGDQLPYTAASGVPRVFHTLERATEVARELGFASIRVEERF